MSCRAVDRDQDERGSSDLAVEERASLDAFTDKDNRVVYMQRSKA
jgi:hypothetical protein